MAIIVRREGGHEQVAYFPHHAPDLLDQRFADAGFDLGVDRLQGFDPGRAFGVRGREKISTPLSQPERL